MQLYLSAISCTPNLILNSPGWFSNNSLFYRMFLELKSRGIFENNLILYLFHILNMAHLTLIFTLLYHKYLWQPNFRLWSSNSKGLLYLSNIHSFIHHFLCNKRWNAISNPVNVILLFLLQFIFLPSLTYKFKYIFLTLFEWYISCQNRYNLKQKYHSSKNIHFNMMLLNFKNTNKK